MPGKYSRTTKRQSWSEEAMSKAIEAVSSGQCGYLKAAKMYSVPKSTLERRVKGHNKCKTGTEKGLGSRHLTFPLELELQLVDYIKNMEYMLFGLTTTAVRRLAYQLAEKNNLKHHFNTNKEMAGWTWLHSFLNRNKLSIRVPEATSAARARSFNQINVNNFFNILDPIQEQQKFSASRVFNVDETGLTTVQGRPSKVIALQGRKQVGTLTSAERGTLVTAVICMNAAGTYLPPMLIFPRVRMKEEFLNGAPPETIAACHPTGWMQMDLFEKWFDHFLTFTRASKEVPVLLIMDGHKTHTQNIAGIDKARSRGVTLICLPPHCSHRMQPLDVSFMAPMSTFYSQEVEIFMKNNPGQVVTIYHVASLFGKAYLRAATPLNAIHGFEKTGLYPVNRHVFTEVMFAATIPTDVPKIEGESFNHLAAPLHETLTHLPVEDQKSVHQIPPLSLSVEEPKASSSKVISPKSGPSRLISPEILCPYPKASSKSKKTPSRNRGKAAVLTSSPYKNELRASLNAKKKKEKD